MRSVHAQGWKNVLAVMRAHETNADVQEATAVVIKHCGRCVRITRRTHDDATVMVSTMQNRRARHMYVGPPRAKWKPTTTLYSYLFKETPNRTKPTPNPQPKPEKRMDHDGTVF